VPSAPVAAAAPAPTLTAVVAGEKPVPGFRGRTPGEVEPIRGIRKRIVEKMETSRREIPSATCSRRRPHRMWDLARSSPRRRAQGFDVKITPFAMLLRAAVIGLRRFPTLNARIVGREGDEPGEIHLLEASTSASLPTPTVASWSPTSRTRTPSRC
jgi:2-oxoisovalerate dehydrogenase E2 component (dihydrolipoyl transacylase)